MKHRHHIDYNDLIKMAESWLGYMERTYPKKKIEGTITAATAIKNIETGQVLVKLLKKHKKDPQLNLHEMFDKMK